MENIKYIKIEINQCINIAKCGFKAFSVFETFR